MSGEIIDWPTRVPGLPYLWVLSLRTGARSPRCLMHRVETSELGVCDACVSEWRRSLGADPDEWVVCRVCGFPLHPTVEAEGFETCPSCVEVVA